MDVMIFAQTFSEHLNECSAPIIDEPQIAINIAIFMLMAALGLFLLSLLFGTNRTSTVPCILGAIMWFLVYRWLQVPVGSLDFRPAYVELAIVGSVGLFVASLFYFFNLGEFAERRLAAAERQQKLDKAKSELATTEAKLAEQVDFLEHLRNSMQRRSLASEIAEYEQLISDQCDLIAATERERDGLLRSIEKLEIKKKKK